MVSGISARQYAHGLEDLERAWLHTNGFRVLRRLGQRIADSAVDAASGQARRCIYDCGVFGRR
jgi:hypothetical protein